MAPRATTDPGKRTLSLLQAEQLTSAVTGRDAPIPPGSRSRRTKAERDPDGAVYITQRQAEQYLPDGRYKVRREDGTIVRTIEIGAAACSMGRHLVLDRRRVQGAANLLVKERAVQDDLFGPVK